MKQVLLIDIDKTMFDSHAFVMQTDEWYEKKTGITPEIIKQVRAEYYAQLEKDTDFDPYALATHLAEKTKKPFEEVYAVLWNHPQFYRAGVYADVVGCLEKLQTVYTLGVFSEGVIAYQTHKLAASGLQRFFLPENTYIFRRKLVPDSIATLPRNATIIDDREDVLQTLKPHGFETIWINRKDDRKIPGVRTIQSFSELVS